MVLTIFPPIWPHPKLKAWVTQISPLANLTIVKDLNFRLSTEWGYRRPEPATAYSQQRREAGKKEITRITEQKKWQHPPVAQYRQKPYPNIEPCQKSNLHRQDEKQQKLNLRKQGRKCKKRSAINQGARLWHQ